MRAVRAKDVGGAAAIPGACAGADREAEAILVAVFVLAGNTFLRPLVTYIERTPIDESATEATFEVRRTVSRTRRDEIRDFLIEKLESANYPIRDIEEIEREEEVELVATLSPSSVKGAELNAVKSDLEKIAGVSHATWASRASD